MSLMNKRVKLFIECDSFLFFKFPMTFSHYSKSKCYKPTLPIPPFFSLPLFFTLSVNVRVFVYVCVFFSLWFLWSLLLRCYFNIEPWHHGLAFFFKTEVFQTMNTKQVIAWDLFFGTFFFSAFLFLFCLSFVLQQFKNENSQ